MEDYRDRIKVRAEIAGVEIDSTEISILNQQVNDRILRGVCEHDALDLVYLTIKK